MSLSKLILAGVFALWALPASAAYTSAQLVSGPDIQADGSIHYIAVFSGTGEVAVKQDVFLPATASVQTALRAVALKLNSTTSKDKTLPDVGTVIDVSPAGAPVPTVDDTAVASFSALVVAWEAAAGKNAISASFATPTDVSTAATAVVSEYNKGTPSQKVRFDILLSAIRRVFP